MGRLTLAPADLPERWAKKEAEISALRARVAELEGLFKERTDSRNFWMEEAEKVEARVAELEQNEAHREFMRAEHFRIRVAELERINAQQHKDFSNQARDFEDALTRVAELEAALRNLRNELGGCWSVYEDYLREAMGHTNYNCVAERLSQADAALAHGSVRMPREEG